MTALASVYQLRRETLEAYIEQLIALLDELDGDENLEPYLADCDPRHMDDREAEDEREDDPAEAGIADVDALHELYPIQCIGWAI